MAQSASTIIKARGGPAAFAAAIGATPEAVRAMKHRDKLPRSVWPEIIRAFPEITLDALMVVEARAKRPSTPRQEKAA